MVRQSSKKETSVPTRSSPGKVKRAKSVPTRSSPRKVKKARTSTPHRDTDSDGEAVTAVVDQPQGPQAHESPAAEGPDVQAPEGPAEAPEQAPARGRKRQGKKTGERKQYTVSEEHEDDVLEWLRENEYIWRKGHRQYRDTKKKQAAWKDKAESLGYTAEVLLGWWKHMHSWYGKLHLKKSGQAAVRLTDREKYVMAKCTFLEGEIRHRQAAPLRPLSLSQPTDSQACSSQESTTPSRQVSSESPTAETPSTAALLMVPNLEDPVEDGALLSQMEEQAAATRGQPTLTSSSRGRRQRGRLEGQDDSVLLEIRDTMKTSTELLSQLVDLDRASSARKPFITYVSQTLRDLPEAEYQVIKQKITALLLQGPAEAHPTQSRCASPPQASSQPFHGFQQPLTDQGYNYQDFPQQKQNFPVQAQVHRTPQTPIFTQLQTRQPQDTHPYPSSTPQLRQSTDNLSAVLCLTSAVLDEGPLNLTGLSELSDTSLGVLNTPKPAVPWRPSTPMPRQTSTPATATVTPQDDTAPEVVADLRLQ